MKAMILAAGFGTRLLPYTQDIPKPLFRMAGQSLLDIAIKNLIRAGCEAIIVNTHHLHEQIESFIEAQDYGIPVNTCYEPCILGTGGGIKNVAYFWDSRAFMVVNGDIYATIDLKEVYSFHCRHNHPVTLVLYDEPSINTVSIDQNDFIVDFHVSGDRASPPDEKKLTFTGIQVLDPEILDYLPAKVFSSSIDAFKKIMAAGKKIKAHIPQAAFWSDIGTPQRFTQTAIEKNLTVAFERAHACSPDQPVQKRKLKGDGSQRRWYRLSADQQTLIMVDHGIHTKKSTAEIDAFVNIGNHLRATGVAVPQIYWHDRFAGLVFVEDLGDTNLQSVIRRTTDEHAVTHMYRGVIDILVNLSIDGARGFDTAWTYQTVYYDRQLILEKECRYFIEAFLKGYLGWQIAWQTYRDEFDYLAQKALENPLMGFMHRDMQSRNIMLNKNRLYLIDFQGGRLGPLEYDLASLLIDPYVDLPPTIQSRLFDYCLDILIQRKEIDADKFRNCYRYCRLTRNLQILGAFGFLSKVKHKTYFEQYMPAAAKSLTASLSVDAAVEFPGLARLAQKVYHHLQIANLKEE